MYIGTNIEYFAFGAGVGSDPAFGGDAAQTQRNYAWRDYGHRVGMWRLFDLLDEFKLPAAHNASTALYSYRPELMARAHAVTKSSVMAARSSSAKPDSGRSTKRAW